MMIHFTESSPHDNDKQDDKNVFNEGWLCNVYFLESISEGINDDDPGMSARQATPLANRSTISIWKFGVSNICIGKNSCFFPK